MLLSKRRPGSGRLYVPGIGGWSVLVGVVALATVLTFNGADRTILGGKVDLVRAPVPKAEVHHAGI